MTDSLMVWAGHQQQQQGRQQQAGEQGQCCRGVTAGGRAGRVRSTAIEPAVGIVVDHAAGRAHDDHAEGEDQQRPERRETLGGSPQRPPGGPQQQQVADRAVQAAQAQPGIGALAPVVPVAAPAGGREGVAGGVAAGSRAGCRPGACRAGGG